MDDDDSPHIVLATVIVVRVFVLIVIEVSRLIVMGTVVSVNTSRIVIVVLVVVFHRVRIEKALDDQNKMSLASRIRLLPTLKSL